MGTVLTLIIVAVAVIVALKIGGAVWDAAKVIAAYDEKEVRDSLLINLGGPIAGSIHTEDSRRYRGLWD